MPGTTTQRTHDESRKSSAKTLQPSTSNSVAVQLPSKKVQVFDETCTFFLHVCKKSTTFAANLQTKTKNYLYEKDSYNVNLNLLS